MSIKITCPGCKNSFAVADEARGKKMRCRKCEKLLVIPAGSPVEDANDESAEQTEEVEAPRKSKRKKKKAKANLLPVYIGGALLLLAGAGGLVYFLAQGRSPEQKVAEKKDPAPVAPKPPDEQPKVQPKVDLEPPPKKLPSGNITRRMEIAAARNMMRQLGIAFAAHVAQKNRGPADQKQLSPFYENNAKINEYLSNKWVTFIWNANLRNMPKGASHTILAYESDADSSGIRIVLMASGSVEDMDEATFQQAAKAVGQ